MDIWDLPFIGKIAAAIDSFGIFLTQGHFFASLCLVWIKAIGKTVTNGGLFKPLFITIELYGILEVLCNIPCINGYLW